MCGGGGGSDVLKIVVCNKIKVTLVPISVGKTLLQALSLGSGRKPECSAVALSGAGIDLTTVLLLDILCCYRTEEKYMPSCGFLLCV